MKEVIKLLIDQEKNYEEKAKRMKKAIEALQDTCDHNFILEDSTPYYKIEVCTKCLKEIHV